MMPATLARPDLASWQRWALIAGLVGIAGGALGFVVDREQFFRSYLFAFVYWAGMGLGCLAILMLHHVVGGKWGMPIRRLCEAGARTLPAVGVLFIPILLALSVLYPWARPEAAMDANLQRKALYLNVPFFIARAVIYFAIWTFYAVKLSRLSTALDTTHDTGLVERMRSLSAPGLVVFMLTGSFAFIDWVMSLEPHWFSTIYGAMFLIGQTLEAFALVIGLLILLAKSEPFKEYVTAQHLHDLGNLLFAFMVLWAYLSFSQYLIIWAGNLPSEIPWYVKRLRGGWNWIAVGLVVFHFAVPFALLLGRSVKRRPSRLLPVCVLMLAVRLMDVYWLTVPAFYPNGIHLHWIDAALLIGLGGLWIAAFLNQLRSRPMLPLGDARLSGAPRETVAF